MSSTAPVNTREIDCIKVTFKDNVIELTNSCNEPIMLLRVFVYYNYSVELPNKKVIRRRGREEVGHHIELKPSETFRYTFDTRVNGIKIVYIHKDEIKEGEIVIE